ncbi:hypothetical protein GMJLKIPL_5541 [Methylobacterium isbiliense]|uniref:Uncharacterized protein n=2 Tax=Methylobacterium isbiliense TaxID=315478 RepID=A0ABQ4SK29_9HYPH|nr:hypothetical protein GMJLKIPL_5541 [Methylobacterium isbiliense]
MRNLFLEYGGGAGKPAKIYGDIAHLRLEMPDLFKNSDWEKWYTTPPKWWSEDLVREGYISWMHAMRKDISSSAP